MQGECYVFKEIVHRKDAKGAKFQIRQPSSYITLGLLGVFAVRYFFSYSLGSGKNFIKKTQHSSCIKSSYIYTRSI